LQSIRAFTICPLFAHRGGKRNDMAMGVFFSSVLLMTCIQHYDLIQVAGEKERGTTKNSDLNKQTHMQQPFTYFYDPQSCSEPCTGLQSEVVPRGSVPCSCLGIPSERRRSSMRQVIPSLSFPAQLTQIFLVVSRGLATTSTTPAMGILSAL
jgi:hypothetical protein